MRLLRFAVAMSLSVGLAAPAAAPRGTLIVLNKSDHEAALVDPVTLEVLVRIPTGRGPHEVAASPDGTRAYVSNYGSFAIFRQGEQARSEPGKTITVLDLGSRKVAGTIDLEEYRQPHGIRLSRDGSRLWVTCEGNQAVLEIDPAEGKIRKVWRTEQETSHMIVATRDEKKLYVANIGSGSVSVINRITDEVTNLPTGPGAEGIDISPDGKEVWVTNREAHTISVIETKSDRVTASFESGGKMPIRVKFTPDGTQAWVSTARSNAVTVFDAARRSKVATIPVGSMPVGIEISPDGRHAFVANTNDNKVTVIDVKARKAIRSFTTGNEPDGMAWSG